MCEHILFIHSILGCDTTSRLFGLGKGLAVKKIEHNVQFQQQAAVFNQPQSEKEDIISAGEWAIVILYSGNVKDGLDSLRCQRFIDKVSRSTSHVEPQCLPPTSAAAKFHSLRVFYQVMEWKCASDTLRPEEWRWRVKDDKYLPQFTDKPAAPSQLLEVVYCGCKTDCNTRKCTCRKFGLPCPSVYGECRGVSCTNSQQPKYDF